MFAPQPGPGQNIGPQLMFMYLLGGLGTLFTGIQDLGNRLVRLEGRTAGLEQYAKDLREMLPKMVNGINQLVDFKKQEKAEKTMTLWKMTKAVPKFFYVDTFKNAGKCLLSLEPLKGGLWAVLGTSAWTGTIYAAERAAPEPISEVIRNSKGAFGRFVWNHAKPHAISAGKSAAYYGAVGTAKLSLAVGQSVVEDAKDSIGSAISDKVAEARNTLERLPIVGDFVRMASPSASRELSLEDRVARQLGGSHSSSASSGSSGGSDLPALAILVATAGLAYIGWSKLTRYYQARQLEEDLVKKVAEESR